jgi:glutamine synthetase
VLPSGAMDLAQAERFLSDQGIETVECCFPDTWGILTGRRLPTARFLRAAADGLSMPNAPFAWSIRGDIAPLPYTNPDTGYPNMHVLPDLTTLRVAPWAERTGFCLMDAFLEPGGEPNPLDPREILRRSIERLRELGFEALVASELEFYLCTPDWEPIYDDHRPWSMANAAAFEHVLGDIRTTLAAAGVDVESSQTEYGPGQMEINVGPSDPLAMADTATLLRFVVKLVARRHDLRATFMPMPFQGASGSGHHLHISLRSNGSDENAFDPASEGTDTIPTKAMAGFLAGVLAQLRDMTVVNLPSVNAYKRLTDYTFAPNRVCWGFDHRTAAVRVPAEHGAATRLELRTASSDANAYLVIAVALASGARGLADGLAPPPPITSDAYQDDTLERLPRTLAEAAHVFEGSPFATETFGRVFVETFSILARREEEALRATVTDWERARYLETS